MEAEKVFITMSVESQPTTSLERVFEAPLTAVETGDSLGNMCRLCASETEFVVPIYEGDGLQNSLAEKINKHLPIQVSSTDTLPLVVCYQCASTLLAWHELVQCCVQADHAMRTRYSIATSPAQVDQPNNQASHNQSPRHARAPRCFSRSNANTRSRRPTILEERDEDDRIDLKAPSDSSIEDVHDVVPVALPRNSPPRAATDSESTPPPAEDAPPGRGPEPSPPDIKWKPSTPETVAPSTDDFRNDTNGPDHKTPTEKVPGEADRNETPCDSPDRPNEFSDHSDVENEFEPLPNSVFEAIEDTQDVPGPTSLDKNTKHSGAHGKPPRTCPVCNRSYSASSSYYYHLKTHSNDDCECDVCGKKFKTKSALAVHGATHGERRSFSCRKCEKKFSSSAGRYIHERTHTDRKQFACVQCNAAFRWRAQLNRHYARHGSARPHACAQCARAFVTRADLRRHARTHRPGAHACRLCGTRFAQERYLKVHMDKKHYEDGANKPDVKTMYLVKNVSRSGEVIVLNDL